MKSELLIALLVSSAVTVCAGFGYFQHENYWMGSQYILVNGFWAVLIFTGLCGLARQAFTVLSRKDKESIGVVVSVHVITVWLISMFWDIHPPSMREQIKDALYFWMVFPTLLQVTLWFIQMNLLPEDEQANLANSEDPE